MIIIKNADEIRRMRRSGEILGDVLQHLVNASKPGATTGMLDGLAADLIRRYKVKASFKGYHGYPSSICTSINDEIVHGMPSGDRILREGDLLKLDIGILYQGMHTDAGRTVGIGEVSPLASRIMAAAKASFFQCLPAIRSGAPLNGIGQLVQRYSEAEGFSVVRDLVGHGVGRSLHEDPQVPNYYRSDLRMALKRGMTLAIEPMLTERSYAIRTLDDGWTIVTDDGGLSSHYENTVVVTDTEPQILTLMPSEIS